MKLTNSQAKAIERIKQSANERYSRYTQDPVKAVYCRYELKQYGYFISISIEVRQSNKGINGEKLFDLYSMRDICTRESFHASIGKRGKISATSMDREMTRAKLASSPLIFGWSN